MFKDFDLKPFKKKKPPVDSGYTTRTEINELKKIPLNKKFVKETDNIESAFAKTAKNNNIEDYDKKVAAKLIKASAPVIMKLKKHHNRPRPYDLLPSMAHFKIKSMETPSYPSGHSVQGILIGSVLKMKYGKSAFMQTAKNISYSRRVARAHYKSDSKFGEKIGPFLEKQGTKWSIIISLIIITIIGSIYFLFLNLSYLLNSIYPLTIFLIYIIILFNSQKGLKNY